MKKYLMTGMAALAICAAFTSCSKDTDVYNSGVVNENNAVTIVEQYNQKFLKYVGANSVADIPSNQTWGFGGYAKANTRATGEFAGHVGAYPDANMWTSKGFLAPDPLTQSQKLRAQYYFQMNRIVNPNRPNYGTKDFFVQQVYDGGTDPMTGKSAEKYLAADNSTLIESGKHMDHLTAGPDHLHIYNFNNGTCSTNGNVANRDQTDVNNASQQHSDEIQLMLNTPTSCFGYANSDASCVRDDRWTLVSAATIDAFCDGDSNFKTWLADKLKSGEVDKKCDDEFHRDFIGFDFDMIPDELIFSGTQIWEQDPNVSWYSMIYKGMSYTEGDYYRYDLYGAKYHYVSANRNQYCGESKTIDPEPNEAEALTLLQDGWLPASGSANKTWVKVGGCNDGYFSDWIVTFMPADAGDEEEVDPNDVCIIAEDLTVDDDTDFDFNDVVFTVHYTSNTTAEITLYAAGGTLPLKVAGTEVHAKFGYPDADPVTGMYKMINTGAKADVNNVATQTFTVTGINKSERGKDIEIVVNKGTAENPNWIPLTANDGEPAAKLCVGTDFATDGKWCAERVSIKDRYPLFSEWVLNNPTRVWWK
jgi:hypothetical protein